MSMFVGDWKGYWPRSVMYELIAQGEEVDVDGRVMFAICSNGAVFPIMPADELAARQRLR